MKRIFYCLISIALAAGLAPVVRAQGPATTAIVDVVYRADSTPAGGTLFITWPAFETAEAVTGRDVVDENKFRDGLSKIIDGVVECLNASAWAKQR